MLRTKKATATAATVHRGGMEKNHRYYTALREETQAVYEDFGPDTYAAPRRLRHMTREDMERTCMHYEL